MLKRSRKLHLRSLTTTSVLLLVVFTLGFLQFRSTKSWSTKADDSNKLRSDLAYLIKDFEGLEKNIRSTDSQLFRIQLDNFITSKTKIQKRMADLYFYVGKTYVSKADLDSAIVLGNEYLSSYQNILLHKFQSQNKEDWMAHTFHLSDLGLTSFLADIQQKEREDIASQFNESKGWKIYFFSSMGLIAFLFMTGFFYHRMIKGEFDNCDEAMLSDKIYKEIFEHTEKIVGLGHGFFNFYHKKIVFSSNLYRILGFPPNAFPPSFKGYLKQVHPEDRRKVITTLKSLSLTNDTVETDCRIITLAGELKTVELLAIFKIEREERIVIFVNRDTTKEKASELQLLELSQNLCLQNRMFRHVEQIASIGYFSIGLITGKVIFSANLFRMLGFEPDAFKVSKEMLLSFVLEEHKIHVADWLEPKSPGEKLTYFPIKIRTLYGVIKFFSLSREFFVDGETMLLITFKDVTAEALVNQQLELQNQELYRSNMELASFNHIASHDLQEPLRKIQTFISMLNKLDDFHLTTKAQDYLFRIERSANRMQLLILDLLQFSSISKKEKVFEHGDIQTILKNCLDELTILIEESKAKIVFSSLPKAEVIPHQIHQLFKNLIENALKYSIVGVPNTIQIQQEAITDMELGLFPNFIKEELIKISVIDHGIGFDPIHAESIFVIFKRLHGKLEFPGSGIGLAICQRIMENHKGKIFANSSLGKGAKFTFIIPKSQEEVAVKS